MKNMLWYLKKHGNESFEKMPFNEIDALIFSEIGYLNLEVFSNDYNEKIMLKDILNKDNKKVLSKGTTLRLKNEKLCKYFSLTNRYNDVYFKHVKCIIDNYDAEQFAAISFFINDFIYVVFRGTDLSITGWEEDLNMSYMPLIPSQKDSVLYLDEILNKYSLNVIVGGHSKGGNLALYSAINSNNKDRILKIYDFDGPGFLDRNIFLSDEYKKIENKVITITAKMSIVAMTLYNVKNIEFLKTKGIGFFQHDPFNWYIDYDKLKRTKTNSISSRKFEKTIDDLISKTTKEERERFIKIVVRIYKENPDSSLLDIKKHPFKYVLMIFERKRLLSKDDSEFYKEFKKRIRKIFKKKRKLDKN